MELLCVVCAYLAGVIATGYIIRRTTTDLADDRMVAGLVAMFWPLTCVMYGLPFLIGYFITLED